MGSGGGGGLMGTLESIATSALGMDSPSKQASKVKKAQEVKQAKDLEVDKQYKKKKASDEEGFAKKLENQKMARTGGRQGTLLTDPLGTPTSNTGKTLLGQ